MITSFKVIGLIRPVIKLKSIALEADVVATCPSEVLPKNTRPFEVVFDLRLLTNFQVTVLGE